MLAEGHRVVADALLKSLEYARDEIGGVVAIVGPWGSGKTTILDEFARRARAVGAVVVRVAFAREDCEVSGSSFSLLASAIISAQSNSEQAAADYYAAHESGEVPALHSRLEGMVRQRLVVIVIDDLEHADERSRRQMRQLLAPFRRPGLMAVCSTADSWRPGGRAQQFSAELSDTEHHIRPLTENCIVEQLGRYRLEPSWAGPILRATNGSAALTNALARDLTDTRSAGVAESLELRAGTFYRRCVDAALSSLGDEVRTVSYALAIAHGPPELSALAHMTGLPLQTVSSILECLREIGFIDSRGFRVPGTADFLRGRIDRAGRDTMWERSVRSLTRDGANPDVLARTVLEGDGPLSDFDTPALSRAATDLFRTGNPDIAAALAERIVEESGDPAEVFELRRMAAMATGRTGHRNQRHEPVDPAQLLSDPSTSEAVAQPGFQDALRRGRKLEAIRILRLVGRRGDLIAPRTVSQMILAYTWYFGIRSDVAGETVLDAVPALADPWAGLVSVVTGILDPGSAAQTSDACDALLRDTISTEPVAEAAVCVIEALVREGLPDQATFWVDAMRSRGVVESGTFFSALLRAVAAGLLAMRGDRSGAYSSALDALESIPAHHWGVARAYPLAIVMATADGGDPPPGVDDFIDPLDLTSSNLIDLRFLVARARWHVETGNFLGATADLQLCESIAQRSDLGGHWVREFEAESTRLRVAASDSPVAGTYPVAPAAPTVGDSQLPLLSEAELRVVALAADGYTNGAISRRLHVTVSTVEQHLTKVYRKLGVRGRLDLFTGLAAHRIVTTDVTLGRTPARRPEPGKCSGE